MVYAVFVGEVVINAFLLHQTADEIEVSLPILYAVFAGGIAAAKLVLDIGEALVAKHLFDDVGGFFLLEYPAIGGTGQKPQPRPHTGRIIRQPVQTSMLGEMGDITIEEALAVGQVHRYGNVLTE